MKFHEVSKAIDKGKKIKLKDWDNAYWYKKGGIIINPDEEGFECDAREIFPFDLMWVANGDWEIVVENLTFPLYRPSFLFYLVCTPCTPMLPLVDRRSRFL